MAEPSELLYMNDRGKIYWAVWPDSEISWCRSADLVWTCQWSFWVHFPDGGSHLHYVSCAQEKGCCLHVSFHQKLLTHEENNGDFCLCYKCVYVFALHFIVVSCNCGEREMWMTLATVKAFGTFLASWLMPGWLWEVDHIGMVCLLFFLSAAYPN